MVGGGKGAVEGVGGVRGVRGGVGGGGKEAICVTGKEL